MPEMEEPGVLFMGTRELITIMCPWAEAPATATATPSTHSTAPGQASPLPASPASASSRAAVIASPSSPVSPHSHDMNLDDDQDPPSFGSHSHRRTEAKADAFSTTAATLVVVWQSKVVLNWDFEFVHAKPKVR